MDQRPTATLRPIDPLAQRVADTLVQGARFRMANAAGQQVGLMHVPAGRSARGGGAGCNLLRTESGDTPDLEEETSEDTHPIL